jgi:hypothetical protein
MMSQVQAKESVVDDGSRVVKRWRRIWFRFRCKAVVFRLAPCLWIASNLLAARLEASQSVEMVLFVAYVVVMVPAGFLLSNFGCPACGKPFFKPGGAQDIFALPAMFFSNKCRTCGIKAGEVLHVKRDINDVGFNEESLKPRSK